MGWNDANRGLRMKEERAYGKQALDAVDETSLKKQTACKHRSKSLRAD